ncbi:hypothetical protein BH18ACI3_BH18ACI3_08900 [soil metagenome]
MPVKINSNGRAKAILCRRFHDFGKGKLKKEPKRVLFYTNELLSAGFGKFCKRNTILRTLFVFEVLPV